MASRVERPRAALGWCQVLLCAAMAWTAYMLTPVAAVLADQSVSRARTRGSTCRSICVRALLAVLPAAILWGASFPLALAAVAARGQDPARLVGGVYAANTVGAIVGSLGASLVLVAWIGTQHAQQVLMVVAAIAGGILLLGAGDRRRAAPSRWPAPSRRVAAIDRRRRSWCATCRRIPAVLVAYGRYADMRVNDSAQYI